MWFWTASCPRAHRKRPRTGGSASPVRPKVQQSHGRSLQFGGSTSLRLIGKNLYSISYESLMGKIVAAFVCLSMLKTANDASVVLHFVNGPLGVASLPLTFGDSAN